MKRLISCLFVLLLLVSCQTPVKMTPVVTGNDSRWEGEPTYEVFVVARLFSPDVRAAFENGIVRELNKHGIAAVRSGSLYPDIQTLNPEVIREILSKDSKVAIYYTEASTLRRNENSRSGDSSLITNILRTNPDKWDTSFSVMTESALYVNGNHRAVWWNSVKFEVNEDTIDSAVSRYVKNEVSLMEKANVIERLK